METSGRPLYPEAMLFHTHVRNLTSSIVGQSYERGGLIRAQPTSLPGTSSAAF